MTSNGTRKSRFKNAYSKEFYCISPSCSLFLQKKIMLIKNSFSGQNLWRWERTFQTQCYRTESKTWHQTNAALYIHCKLKVKPFISRILKLNWEMISVISSCRWGYLSFMSLLDLPVWYNRKSQRCYAQPWQCKCYVLSILIQLLTN